ncbi:MAG: SusC/RagA family TonB-linked outer membrane protein [Chitinophagaceae bacterium]
MPTKFNLLLKSFFIVLMLFFSFSIFAQKTISGTVTNKTDNRPLQGASVQIKGTTVGTQTDANGNFTITVPNNNSSLIVSVVGFEPLETSVAGRTSFDFALNQTSTALNEVVVTGYTAQRKKDITGSVAIVNLNDAKKIPATSSEQLLQGQASGVTVINSGAPGAPSTVFVRGISNFGHTQPLYVIDGVQVGDMSTVNPNDIESISVLKDAGAAAIYGISGGNGVIVVTTKKGRAGRATISYDAYFGTQRPLSGNVWHLMNPAQQSELAFRANDLATEALYPGGPGIIPTYGYHGNTAAGPFGVAGVTSDTAILKYYHFDASNPGNDFLIQKFATGSGTDWFHSVFKPAFEQQQTITASGGSDKSTYLFSVNYLNQQGTLLNNYEKRYAARLNTTFNIKNNIRFGESGFITYRQNNGGYNGTQQQEGGSIAYTFREMPIIPVYDIAGNYGGGYTGPTGEPLGNGSNPYAILARQATNNAHFVTIQGNIFAEVDVLKHFTLHTSIGGNLYNQYYWSLGYTPYENYESHANGNSASENEQMSSNYNWTNTILYKQVFGKHNLQVLGGYEVKASSGREFHASAESFFSLDPNYVQLQFGTPVNAPTSYIYQPTSTISYFGRLDYIYNEKYILGATIRRDGYSIFSPGKQYGTFPSVSLGWRLSQEEFMKGIVWLNNLMLRGSYGEAGNNGNIGGNNAYSTYASGTGASYYGITGSNNVITQGFYQNQNGNPNVTWETDKITNVGLDATLFNHFDFSVEWYKKAISGLLFPLPLPATVGGAAVPSVNVGDVENKGLDISATYRARVGKDFSFSIGANVTTYKSLITNIPSPGYFDFGGVREGNVVRNQVGHPIGEFFGYQTEGIYQDTTSAKLGATYSGASAGSFIYKDVSGDGKIDANDRTWIGNPNPNFTYGINLGATYKKFDFTMVLYGSQGNKDFNYVKYWTDFYSTFQGGKNLDLYNKAAIVSNGVVTNPGATLPAASFAQSLGSSAYSTFYVEDGSFLKCRVAQLGYTFDPLLLKKVGVDKLHLYIQATNLFTITKYSGLDPELVPSLSNNGSGVNQSAAFGIDYGAYPNNQKQYIIGVNLTF